VLDALQHLALRLLTLPAAVPNPGAGTEPPFSGKLNTLLQWGAWTVTAICVGGVFIVAGRMAVQHQRGEGGQHLMGLSMVLGACVLLGTASSIVGALVGG
jgi:hypothetical protein